jgi:hypothetical protein
MSIQRPFIATADFEDAFRTVAALMTSPFRDALGYVLPRVESFRQNLFPIHPKEPSLHVRMNEERAAYWVDRINTIGKDLGVSRSLALYVQERITFDSVGGLFSLSSPWVVIPTFAVDAHGAKISFTKEEIDFFIARQVCKIRSFAPLLQATAKVLFIASFFFFYNHGIRLPTFSLLMAGSAILYFTTLRLLERRFDIEAAEYMKNKQIALGALTKWRDFQLVRRSGSLLGQLIISAQGNNLFSILRELSTTERIDLLESLNLPAEPVLDSRASFTTPL